MNKRLIFSIVAACAFIILLSVIVKRVAISRSSRHLKMTQNRVQAIYDYADTLTNNKEYEKAKRAYEIVSNQKINPAKKEDALFKLASIYEKDNSPIKARDAYRKIIDEFPDSARIADAKKEYEKKNMSLLLSDIITKDSVVYEVKSGDTLGKIAKKYNTTVYLLRKSNHTNNDIIVPRQRLKVPKGTFGILVDKSQNVLMLKRNGDIIKTYIVSTGANNSTPEGKFVVEEKLISPVWYKMGAIVSPDSPDYELGKYWMGISRQGYGIHGTSDQSSIGKHITKGCVRMSEKDIEELFSIAPTGTTVEIVN